MGVLQSLCPCPTDGVSLGVPAGPQRVQLVHGAQPDEHGAAGGAAARHGLRGAGARPHCGRLRQVQWQDVLPDPHRW